METIWDVLGIEPTTDESEIRRAYARELKQRRPDKDPQGFQQLREAFDNAKRYASGIAVQEVPQMTSFSCDEQPRTAVTDYVHNLMTESSLASETPWQREELKIQATEIAELLVENEYAGLERLQHYLDQEIPDALEAQRVFSLALAEKLGAQPWLNRSVVHEVSAVMNWEVENYRSSQLPLWILNALEEQIATTDQENHWQYLARQYSYGRLEQLKWRLLTDKDAILPWWARLIPDFVLSLGSQVFELKKQYPGLIDRLNPKLLETFSRPALGLNWNTLIAVWFWGYTAWLPGHESQTMAIQSLVMLVIVSSYIWGYPMLDRKYLPGSKAHKALQAAVWMFSMTIISLALYKIGRWLGYDLILLFLAFVVAPVSWIVWSRRKQWRTLPISIVVTTIMFPILIIRQFPPVINLMGLLLLPMLYGFLIQAIYFVK
ncbi:J domain-containing protein [Budvicia aquatica]|uniref:J domain-containing protein n=1 Tax=Budvicia aquatica TaxID=82979 RepID=UPI0020834D3E|nr:J domain-containing protein [Budvicia aquatica]GKX51572.1 hypothetical protein SOASR029_18810 [Budvicia aquatica]